MSKELSNLKLNFNALFIESEAWHWTKSIRTSELKANDCEAAFEA